jgi:hypothetical protein
MPALTKKKPERTLADLAADIERIQQEIAEFVDARVAEQKVSYSDLPSEVLRQTLVRLDCPCKCALRLINES